jgi:hypothetical protein
MAEEIDKQKQEQAEEINKQIDAALGAAVTLIQAADGDIEFVRGIWNDVFEEAERIDHNQTIGDAFEDEWEIAVREQTERFEQAVQRRENMKVVSERKDD